MTYQLLLFAGWALLTWSSYRCIKRLALKPRP